MKAEYICADQPVTLIFRLRQSGGPYIPVSPSTRHDRQGDRTLPETSLPCKGLAEVGASFEQMSSKAVTQGYRSQKTPKLLGANAAFSRKH